MLIGNTDSFFISQLKHWLHCLVKYGGRLLRQNIPHKDRKALAAKMCKALKPEIKMLNDDMQKILVDDLITAFFSRLEILKKVTEKESEDNVMIQYTNDISELIHGHHGRS